MLRSYLFDESTAREEVDLRDALGSLSDRQLLWIDTDGAAQPDHAHAAAAPVRSSRRVRIVVMVARPPAGIAIPAPGRRASGHGP